MDIIETVNQTLEARASIKNWKNKSIGDRASYTRKGKDNGRENF